tara:strand:- start:220 stop:834 length:615 start_codon:yes stop_codon:yes gene_type:complete
MTKIEICNHALLKIGADTIASLDINQNDQEAVVQSAKLCNIFFNQALEEVLRTYRWNSALRRATLPRLSEAPAFKFKYKYQMPNDCVRVVNVYDNIDAYDDRTEWVVEGRTILCNYEAVYLCYVSLVEDVNTLDAFLTQCVIQNLAIKLSVPMQLDQVMQNNLISEYNNTILPQARSVDTLENKYWEMEESDFLLSRYNQSPII